MAKKAFPILFLIAWACVAALVKWDARWLYLLLGGAVLIGLFAGREERLPIRVLLLLALVFPAWKKGELVWRHHGAGRAEVTDAQDAKVISALVAAEETYLVLTPKLNALANHLVESRRLEGTGLGGESVFASPVSVTLAFLTIPEVSA